MIDNIPEKFILFKLTQDASKIRKNFFTYFESIEILYRRSHDPDNLEVDHKTP